MRRVLVGSLGVAALLVAAPGAALAQHHGSHHRSHHAARVRFEHLDANGASSSSTPVTPSMTGAGTHTASPVATQDAGTIVSFANNVLTIKLTDGSSVSALVSPDTRIECVTATARMADHGGGSGSSDGSGDGGGNGNTVAQGGDENGSANDGDNGDRNDNAQADDPGDNQATTCDSSSLIARAVVHEAELRLSSSGSQFMSIVLSQ